VPLILEIVLLAAVETDLLDLLEDTFVDRALALLEMDILCSDVKLLKALGYHNLGLDGVKVLLEDYDVPQRLLHIVDLLEF
jgi:hypothetical protein